MTYVAMVEWKSKEDREAFDAELSADPGGSRFRRSAAPVARPNNEAMNALMAAFALPVSE